MPLEVQLPLPTIGLELYQLGVHIRAKNLSSPLHLYWRDVDEHL